MRTVQAQFRRRTLPSRVQWAVVVTALGVSAVLAWVASVQVGALAMQERAAQVQRTAATREPEPEKAKPYDASVREMLRQGSSRWPLVLIALERVSGPEVRVRRIDIGTEPNVVRVEVQADSHRSALDALDALNLGNSGLDPAEVRWTLERAEADKAAASSVRAIFLATVH